MKNASPKVDAYIEKAADFAKPILKEIRRLYHQACPDIEETIKWGIPHFELQGMVGHLAAFKQHVSFGFWKGQLMKDKHKLFEGVGNTNLNAIKVKSLEDLPAAKVILEYIKEAVDLNKSETKPPKPAKKKEAKELEAPDYFMAALKNNKSALATFEKLSPSHKREYIEWITEAKQEATRKKRLATAIEWMSEGKPRNWKYMKKQHDGW